ncbi:hypothetical protein CRG98_035933 [Punica granatum]|uniref:Uncharacterized protein n=1 Tax=Punica granatum TaxID=22663 RepID=A0A2I0IIT2_PUNGR|nr:hypothetical protein CRG98_035933 [Punica granatum]
MTRELDRSYGYREKDVLPALRSLNSFSILSRSLMRICRAQEVLEVVEDMSGSECEGDGKEAAAEEGRGVGVGLWQ